MATTKGGLAKRQAGVQTKVHSIKDLIRSMEPQIKAALPSILTPERFTRMVLTALSSNPKLQECSPQSFLGAMMQAAQLGVEPNTPLGQAYLIPYRNHGILECQFQLGYKGLIDLAYRSGSIRDISAHVVYSGDGFEFEYGFEPKLIHKPAMTDRGTPIAYYAVYHTKDGGGNFVVMSQEDIEKYRNKFSKAAGQGFSPWGTNFEEMAKKTVLKKLLKYAPLKTEFVRAVATDETVKSNIMPDMADQPNEMDYAEAAEVQEEPVAAIEDKDSSIQAPAMELQTEDVKVPQK